jgi:hypothetical protein
MAVSSYLYQSRRWDEPLRTRLVELAREKPRFGYRRLHVLLVRQPVFFRFTKIKSWASLQSKGSDR